MNLTQALALLGSTGPRAERAKHLIALHVIEEILPRLLRKYYGAEELVEDAVQTTLLEDFMARTAPLEDIRTPESYMYSMCNNKVLEFIRRRSVREEHRMRSHEGEERDVLEIAEARQIEEGALAPSSCWHEAKELMEQQTLVTFEAHEAFSLEEFEDRLIVHLCEIVVPQISARKDARANMCRALHQLVELHHEEVDMDELVDKAAGSKANARARRRARDRIHQNHKRTRTRLLKYFGLQQSAVENEYDHHLMGYFVEVVLRQRAHSRD